MEVAQPGLIPLSYSPKFEGNPNNTAEVSQESVPQKPKPRIFGLRKVTFWLVLGLATLSLAVIGVVTGLGVGLSKARSEGVSPYSLANPKPRHSMY
jgi:hypothetical protein